MASTQTHTHLDMKWNILTILYKFFLLLQVLINFCGSLDVYYAKGAEF